MNGFQQQEQQITCMELAIKNIFTTNNQHSLALNFNKLKTYFKLLQRTERCCAYSLGWTNNDLWIFFLQNHGDFRSVIIDLGICASNAKILRLP